MNNPENEANWPPQGTEYWDDLPGMPGPTNPQPGEALPEDDPILVEGGINELTQVA